jgi:hypothetical protein
MSILERRKARASKMLLSAPIAALAMSGLSGTSAQASPIGNEDVLFFQGGTVDSPDSLAGSILTIDDLNTTNNTLVQQFNITNITGDNTAGNSTTLFTNNNGSNGQLALSDNGTLVTFGGYQGNTSNDLNQVTRQAVAINLSGIVTTAASYYSSANGQVRSAFTPDGTNYLFADKSGVFTGGSSSAANGTNVRFLAGFGGTDFALAQGNGLNSTNSFFTYSAGTLTPLTISGNFGNGTDFDFLQSGFNGSAYDTLYVANGTQILKYDYTGGSLSAEGALSITAAAGTTGKIADLTAVEVGSNTVDIYFTTTMNATDDGTVEEVVDSAGWDNPLSGSVTPNVLYTAGTGVDLFGITTVPEPTSASLLGLAGLALMNRRRRRRSVAT